MIINLTQHAATPDQAAAGVVDLEGEERTELVRLLTFEDLPTGTEIRRRASAVAEMAARSGAQAAMVGGAPYLMAPLEEALRARGVHPLYAFSRRESVEEAQPDGSVKKLQVFRHLGFVEGVRAAEDSLDMGI